MWSAHSYYMVEVMLVRYVNINARCRASGVLVPLACVVQGIDHFGWSLYHALEALVSILSV